MCIGASEDQFNKIDDFVEFYKNSSSLESVDDGQSYPRMVNSPIDNFEYYTEEQFNKKVEFTNNDLNVLSINVRGIAKNYDNLITYLNTLKNTFSVIILSECHIQESILGVRYLQNMYNIPGYNMNCILSKIKYGGVIIYTKDQLNVSVVSELTDSNDVCDVLYLQVMNNSKRKLFIGGLYRHCRSRSSDIMNFIGQFEEQLNCLKTHKNDVIVGGDLNICLMKSVNNNDSLCLLNTILGSGLETHIIKPTRISHYPDSMQIRSMSLIDIICSNMYPYQCKSGNILYPDSDHYATFVNFTDYFIQISTDKPDIYRRNINDIDQENLIADFNNFDWNSLVFNEPNLDNGVENLLAKIDTLLEKHAPLKKVSKRKQKYCQKPWIDRELLEDIKHKNKLFGEFKKRPTHWNKTIYQKYNNSVTAKRRAKKSEYFRNYFEKHRHDTKKMWLGIEQALESSKAKKSVPFVVTDTNGKELSDPAEISNSFAKYFEQVPIKTMSKIKIENDKRRKRHYLEYLHKNRPINNYLSLYDTHEFEVETLIMNLNDRSSPGPINVPNRFIKLLMKPLGKIMTFIANVSMNIGYVPLSFKIGKQTPVFKSGPVNITNFRPITVCNSLSKILEKIVRKRLMEHLKASNVLTNSQFGFRSKHSTTHAMINLLETSLSALDDNLTAGGIFLDISKAFDCVNHDKLIRKLEYYGVRANALIWFQSYLDERSQFVTIRNIKSNAYKLACGVPQGGTLAPILFILFVNDIIHSSKVFDFSIYADDTCLIIGLDRVQYDDTLKLELQKVMEWFTANDLLVNVSKTDYLFLGPNYHKNYIKGEHDMSEIHKVAPEYIFVSDDPEDPDHHTVNKQGEFAMHDIFKVCPKYFRQETIIADDGNIIVENENVKYLGLYFDSSLNFKRQTAIISCKINRMVGIMWKMPDINILVKKIIYHSLVESHLNYGILIWASSISKNVHGNFSEGHIPNNLKTVKKAQNKVLRAIFGKPKYDKKNKIHTDMSPLYKELKVLKLHDLYYYNLSLLCFDYHNTNGSPDKIDDFFTKKDEINTKTTRASAHDFYYKPPRVLSSYRKPSLVGSAFWNALPSELKVIKSKNSFKMKLKKYFIDKY